MGEIIGEKDFRVIFVGNLSHKKGYQLLLMAFDEIYRYDPRHTLHIFGRIDEMRASLFMDSYISEAKLQDAIQYYGHVDNLEVFIPHYSHFLVTSPLEGSPVGLLQCASYGLNPYVFAFFGSRLQYPDDWLWKNFDELLAMVKAGPQPPEKIKKFVRDHYSLQKQLDSIDRVVSNLLKKGPKVPKKEKKTSISAIVAVKNGEKTIARALNSLINQTRILSKIVVVNDGSTDKTEEIVKELSLQSRTPIEMITNAKSKWVFAARTQGVEFVNSDYFFFLDSDDWIDSQYVEKLAHILDTYSSIDVVYPDLTYFEGNGKEQIFTVPEFDGQVLAQRNFIAYASMQRTIKFRGIGGYNSYLNDSRNHLSEWYLWLNYLKTGHSFKRFPEPLFHYLSGDPAQMSGNYETSRENMHLQMAVEIMDGANGIQMGENKERILLVCQGTDYCDRSKTGFELMTWSKPLEMNGKYEVYLFQYDVEIKHFGRNKTMQRLKDMVDLIKPTFIFHPSYKTDIPVSVWKSISENYDTICFNSDDDRRWDTFSQSYGEGFRWVVTTYPQIYERMTHQGRLLSSWACNTKQFYPTDGDKIMNVSFVGQKYGDREEMLSGLNVSCYGFGWPNGFVDFKEMAGILRNSKISINMAKGSDGNPQLKLRPFEVCGSKTLCLCEYVEGIEQFFGIEDILDNRKEIVVFRNKDELKDLIDYYLAHDAEREAIAQAGYERVISEHKWEDRLSEIFSKISSK